MKTPPGWRAPAKRRKPAIKRNPSTPAEIAACLRDLSARMLDCGTAMDYYGGFNGNMVAHGLELIGAARIAEQWAGEIEDGTKQ